MIGVFLPLLLVFASVGVLLICKPWRGADQPTGTNEEESEESQNIEPYAVVYSVSAEVQGCDNNSSTGSQPTPAQSPVDSETIKPYAVVYDEDQGPESDIRPYAVAYGDEDQGQEDDIKPYAVAHKEDVGQDDSCRIPLYGAGCPDTAQAAGGQTEAGATQLENITEQPAIVDEPVADPEGQSPPTDGETEPKYVKEVRENKRSTSNALYNPAHGQHESVDSTSNVLYNPVHGQQ